MGPPLGRWHDFPTIGKFGRRRVRQRAGAFGLRTFHHASQRDRQEQRRSHHVGCAVDPWRLVINEDGSLTSANRSRLEAELAGIRVVGRKQADEIMSEKLRSHPHAWRFREDSIWGLKLLDVALLEKGDCFYID